MNHVPAGGVPIFAQRFQTRSLRSRRGQRCAFAPPALVASGGSIRKLKGMSSMEYHPFPKTHWSLVRRAGGNEETDRQARKAALAALLARYQPALRSYLRVVRRMPADAADDLLQDFIADKLLEQDLLR